MIICDTNIWYTITKDIIEKNNLQGKLVCTHTTLVELKSSPNLYKRPELVKRAINAIRDFAVIQYINPYEYGVYRLISNYEPYKKDIGDWEGLKIFADRVVINEENKAKMKLYVEENRQGIIDAVAQMNEEAIGVKEFNKGKKKEVRKRDYKIITRKFLKYFFESATKLNNRTLEIPLEDSNWINLELIEKALSAFYMDIDISPSQKIQVNDWADIIMMVYVGKDDLYWCKDSKWRTYIEHTVPQYLYRPSYE